MRLSGVTHRLCKVAVVPGIDDALALDPFLISFWCCVLNDGEQETLNICLPVNRIGKSLLSSLTLMGNGTDMDEVKTKGIFIFVPNAARILTFFSSSSGSIEWTQPQVPC